MTAQQELAALILAYAALVDYRVAAAAVGEVGVLRISFVKTLHVVQGLWQFLTLAADLLTPWPKSAYSWGAACAALPRWPSQTAAAILSASLAPAREPVATAAETHLSQRRDHMRHWSHLCLNP